MVGFVGERLESADCATWLHFHGWPGARFDFRQIDGWSGLCPNRLDQCHVSWQRSARSRPKSCPRAFDWLRHRGGFVCVGECFLSRAPVVSRNPTRAARSRRGRGHAVRVRKSGRGVHGSGDHDFHVRLQQWADSRRSPRLFAMARDRLFFKKVATTNRNHVPAAALVAQGIWTALLTLPRTVTTNPTTHKLVFGNVYTQLLEYIVSADLIFYLLMVLALIVLRRKAPAAERPYRTWGYPVVPIVSMLLAALLIVDLAFLAPTTSGIGILIVLTGMPVYFLWRMRTQL